MKLHIKTRKKTSEEYYVITYEDDDAGFFLRQEGLDRLYPSAILVWPRPTGWLCRIQWSDYSTLKATVIESEIFNVGDKQIFSIPDGPEVKPHHKGLWMHCSMLIKQHMRERKIAYVENNPALKNIPPTWQVWKKPTIKDLDSYADLIF